MIVNNFSKEDFRKDNIGKVYVFLDHFEISDYKKRFHSYSAKGFHLFITTGIIKISLVDGLPYHCVFPLFPLFNKVSSEEFLLKIQDETFLVVPKKLFVKKDLLNEDNYITKLDNTEKAKFKFYLTKGYLPEQANYEEKTASDIDMLGNLSSVLPFVRTIVGRYII